MTTRMRSGLDVLSDFTQQGQGHIRVQVPLVELVEHDRSDRLEERIGQKPSRQDAFGDELKACRARYSPFKADLIADLIAERPPTFVRDPRRGGAGRDATRLKDEYLWMLG